MRETRSSGSVEGVMSNRDPYSDYEEPTLRRKFGADYEQYCRNVRRWRPRVRAWDKPQ
jgi:hypothetical protein